MQTQCYVSSRRRSCSTSRRCARNYTSRRPFKAISPVTMSRWLQDAGSPEGSAWDVRSVGLSTEIQTNMDISKVLKAANWTRLTTMQRHYFKPQCLQSLTGILYVTSWVDWYYFVATVSRPEFLLLLWADYTLFLSKNSFILSGGKILIFGNPNTYGCVS